LLRPLSSLCLNQAIINLEISINSGQMFLWKRIDNAWYGIYGEHILKFSTYAADPLQQNKNINNNDRFIEFYSFPAMKGWEQHVFRLDDDIKYILSSFSKDTLVSEAIRRYPGLRLMRQDPYQCMFSFLCASNTNILMIRRMLNSLSRKFGRKIVVDGKEFFTFPTATDLNRATIADLCSCGLGYRSKAVKLLAESISHGNLDVKYLIQASYDDAKTELLKVYGIGNKIADCILLFSLEKLEAFPIDVWITRALSHHYNWLLSYYKKEKENSNRNKKINYDQYITFSETIRKYFGKYSGYAQQYLFYHMRQNAGKKW
jgi:N-glycosylase/DNA lyase